MGCSDDERAALRLRISNKPLRWVAFNLGIGSGLWLTQSLLLWEGENPLPLTTLFGFMMALGPLLVWVCMTCALHALIDNARLFRRVHRLVPVNVLDPGRWVEWRSAQRWW